MRKYKKVAILLIFIIVCLSFGGCTSNHKETIESTDSLEIIDKLGVGWNLGNTLDSCDYKKTFLENAFPASDNYQLMLTYQTEYWTGWDASETPYFDENGEVTLTWKIDSLTSELNANCGKISFQVFNNAIQTEEEHLIEVKVEYAEVKLKDGTSLSLDHLEGRHNLVFKGECSTYVEQELQGLSNLRTSGDLIGSSITIKAKLVKGVKNALQVNMTDAVNYYESLWGNPRTGKLLIDQVVESGFGAIRVPVTYYDHMDSNYVIDDAWLNRVKEVVDYAIENKVYCIINLHHEEKWLNTESSTKEVAKKGLQKVWEQIATVFQDQSEYLIFEGFNEVLSKDRDWSGNAASYGVINELNQVFVDTVRNTGGKNTNRYLLVNTYAANIDSSILEAFELPKDTAKNRLIVGVHTYAPLMFSWTDNEMKGASNVIAFDKKGEEELRRILESLYERFTSRGIPVIIGEFGSWNKNNEDERKKHATYLISEAKNYHIACFWWDMGGKYTTAEEVRGSALFNRETGKAYYPSLVNAMVGAVK